MSVTPQEPISNLSWGKDNDGLSFSAIDHQESGTPQKTIIASICPMAKTRIASDPSNTFLQPFQEFCDRFGFDPIYGSCLDYKTLESLPSEYSWIEELIMSPDNWRTRKMLVKSLEGKSAPTNLPTLTERQATRLISATFHMINVYLFCREDPDHHPQTVPAPLAVPHVQACRLLRLQKLSLGFSHMFASWKLNDSDGSPYDLRNYGTKVSFTDTEGDRVFNGLSLILTFHLQKVNSMLFEASARICRNQFDGVAVQLRAAAAFLDGFIPQMKTMFSALSVDYFMSHYRFFLQGFDDALLFPHGVAFAGTDVVARSTGGSAGGDPCVQVFERFVGLKFPGVFDSLQDELQLSFVGRHKDCVQFLEKHHVIRPFLESSPHATADMVQAYNELLEVYAGLFRKHYGYVHHYLIDKKPEPRDPHSVQGTGGIRASDLGKKACLIESFKLEPPCLRSPISEHVLKIKVKYGIWSPQFTNFTKGSDIKEEESSSPLNKYLHPNMSSKSPKKISRGCPFGFK